MYQVLFDEPCEQEEVNEIKSLLLAEFTSQWRETRP